MAKYILTDTVLTADVVNKNGRIYPLEVLQSIVDNYQDKIKERRMLGTFGMPASDTISLSALSHVITELKMVDNNLVATAEILGDSYNSGEKTLVKYYFTHGVKLALRTAGFGTLDDRNVVRGYELISINIVEAEKAS